MPINKIIYEDNVLIDLTEDSVTPDTLVKGVTAHDKAGNKITGTHECSGGGEGAVIKAPGGWQGTPVPSDGVTPIENVYVNTNMSVEEVISLVSQLTYSIEQEDEIYSIAMVWAENSADVIKHLSIVRMNGMYAIALMDNTTQTEIPMFIYIDGSTEIGMVGFSGWFPGFEGVVEINDKSIPIAGLENDKLSSLFSITPFTEGQGEEVILEGEYDGSIVDIDVQAVGSSAGTVVPNSGYVEKVYLNTNLSVDEVKNILVNSSDMFLLVSEDYSTMLMWSFDSINGTNNYLALRLIANGDATTIFQESDVQELGIIGWNPAFTGEITIDNNVVSTFNMGEGDMLVGTQNDKLVNLLSITPFSGGSSEPVIDLKSYIENKQIPLKINLTNLPSEAVIKTTGGWQGTVVPNSGLVEKIYFNTNLSFDEVVALLNQLTYTDPMGNGVYMHAIITHNAAELGGMGVGVGVVTNDENNRALLFFRSMEDWCIIFAEEPGFYIAGSVETAGWQIDAANSVFDFNMEAHDSYEMISLPSGTQNDLLSSLVSTTPFVQSEGEEVILEGEYDGAPIEINELPKKDGWSGTVVPGDGSLLDIYVNTALSNEEVFNMLESLDLEPNRSYYVYKFERGSGIDGIYIQKSAFGYEMYCKHDGYNVTIFSYYPNYDDVVGWRNVKFDNPLTFTSYEGTPIALSDNQNDKLVDLFSITPHVQGEVNTINLLAYIEDKKIPSKIKVNVEKEIIECAELPLLYKSTPVPTEGYIEKVYVNINLSVDEVMKYFDSLMFIPDPTGTNGALTACITDTTMSNAIFLYKHNTSGSCYINMMKDGDSTILFAKDGDNVLWDPTFNGVVEMNMDNSLYLILANYNLTSENDKMSNLFSITPFEKNKIDEGQIYHVINENVDENYIYLDDKLQKIGIEDINIAKFDFEIVDNRYIFCYVPNKYFYSTQNPLYKEKWRTFIKLYNTNNETMFSGEICLTPIILPSEQTNGSIGITWMPDTGFGYTFEININYGLNSSFSGFPSGIVEPREGYQILTVNNISYNGDHLVDTDLQEFISGIRYMKYCVVTSGVE